MRCFKVLLLLFVVISCKKETKYPIEVKQFYKNGNIQQHYFLDKDSLQTNYFKSHYNSGQLETYVEMRYGIMDGHYENFYNNGVLKIKGEYKDGFKDGKFIMFHKNNTPEVEVNFIKDKIVGEALFYDDKSRFVYYKNYNNLGDLRYRLTLDTLGVVVEEKGDKISSVSLNVESESLVYKNNLQIFLNFAHPPTCKQTIYTKLNGIVKDSTTVSSINYDYKVLPTDLGNNKLEIFVDYSCEDYKLKSDYFTIDFEVVE